MTTAMVFRPQKKMKAIATLMVFRIIWTRQAVTRTVMASVMLLSVRG